MSVAITGSKVLGGAAVSDDLEGGGDGIDLGFLLETQYVPIILKLANSGWQTLYINHDGTDEITGVRTFIDEYSQVYGGQASAAADYTVLKNKGLASSTSSNNSDGNGAGLRIEHDADLFGVLGLSAFDGTRSQVKIYGRDYGSGAEGIDLATAFPIHIDSMIRNNAGTAVDATAPVEGKIGPAGDAALGDTAAVKLRLYLEENPATSGLMQWDWVVSFAFTG